jgi:hypothetical protein
MVKFPNVTSGARRDSFENELVPQILWCPEDIMIFPYINNNVIGSVRAVRAVSARRGSGSKG